MRKDLYNQRAAGISSSSHTSPVMWDRWDLRWWHIYKDQEVLMAQDMPDTKYGKISWTNLGIWIWITIYIFLTSDIFTFFNGPHMAFSVL